MFLEKQPSLKDRLARGWGQLVDLAERTSIGVQYEDFIKNVYFWDYNYLVNNLGSGAAIREIRSIYKEDPEMRSFLRFALAEARNPFLHGGIVGNNWDEVGVQVVFNEQKARRNSAIQRRLWRTHPKAMRRRREDHLKELQERDEEIKKADLVPQGIFV